MSRTNRIVTAAAMAGVTAVAAPTLAPTAVAESGDAWPYSGVGSPFDDFYPAGERTDMVSFPPFLPLYNSWDQNFVVGPDDQTVLFSTHTNSLQLGIVATYHEEVTTSNLDVPPVGTTFDQSSWIPYMDLTQSWVVPRLLLQIFTTTDPVHGTHSLLEGFGGWATNEFISDSSGISDVLTLAADSHNPVAITLFDLPTPDAAADATDWLG